mgnify:CR=1 FL=1
MSKSDEYREMQISSGQLAAVILVLLALCVFVFYLGTRVGMKKAEASSPVAAAASDAHFGCPDDSPAVGVNRGYT